LSALAKSIIKPMVCSQPGANHRHLDLRYVAPFTKVAEMECLAAEKFTYHANILKNCPESARDYIHGFGSRNTLELSSTQALASITQLNGFPWKSQLTSSSCSTVSTPARLFFDAASNAAMISGREVSFSRLRVRSTRETLQLDIILAYSP
jgi:hypothetical protein